MSRIRANLAGACMAASILAFSASDSIAQDSATAASSQQPDAPEQTQQTKTRRAPDPVSGANTGRRPDAVVHTLNRNSQTRPPETNKVPEGVSIVNPRIDADAFKKVSEESLKLRQGRRLSETEFIRMASEPGTIVLDARSRDRYNIMHVKGAINLSFPDIDVNNLAQILPDKNARILIYCNNNFSKAEVPFAYKNAPVSLNVPTFINLYAYGYRNVFELAPLIDLSKPARLKFENGAGKEVATPVDPSLNLVRPVNPPSLPQTQMPLATSPAVLDRLRNSSGN